MTLSKILGVDAEGGDDVDGISIAERATLATLAVARRHSDYKFFLVGKPEEIEKSVENKPDNVVIEPGRGRKFRAITRLGDMIRDEQIGMIYTCGNNKTIVPVVTNKIGLMKEVSENFPNEILSPLLVEAPKSPTVTRSRTFYLLDAGSIPQLTSPEQYLLFASMGVTYARAVGKRENPMVGLLNIGTEAGKGSELVRQAHKLLRESNLNFIGNVEPHICIYDREKGTGKECPVDVVVASGTEGNLLIKGVAAGANLASDFIKYEVGRGGLIQKLAAFYLKLSAFKRVKKLAEPSQTGGAWFICLDKPAIKNHGTATIAGIERGLENYVSYVENNIHERIRETAKYVSANLN